MRTDMRALGKNSGSDSTRVSLCCKVTLFFQVPSPSSAFQSRAIPQSQIPRSEGFQNTKRGLHIKENGGDSSGLVTLDLETIHGRSRFPKANIIFHFLVREQRNMTKQLTCFTILQQRMLSCKGNPKSSSTCLSSD